MSARSGVTPARPRVVIPGAGFGGLFAARAVSGLDADITVVDRHHHHLFQPLLYQVATAGLAPSDIAWPIRSVLARQHNASVRFGTVTGIDTATREVLLDNARLPYDYLVCATGARHSYFGHDDWARHATGLKGVIASPVGRWLGTGTDGAGRVPVTADLTTESLPDIFVIGDAASAVDVSGQPVPGIAPAAKQQGRHVARVLRARLTGAPVPGPFRYRHAGKLATIGRGADVAEFPRLRLTGFPAWLLWGVAHVYFLIGLPSPFLVTVRWLREYATYRRGARMITGRMPSADACEYSSALAEPPSETNQ